MSSDPCLKSSVSIYLGLVCKTAIHNIARAFVVKQRKKTLIPIRVDEMTHLTCRSVWGLDLMFLKSSIQRFSSFVRPNEFPELPGTMSAWQICGYKGFESLKLVNTVEVPPLSQPNDVLVKVKAASVNAIDVMMTGIAIVITYETIA